MADREFIAAKDLPITEAEEVDVLVVNPETGELGLKAGANLGGSGGGVEPDLVVRINNYISDATVNNIEVVSGSVEAVYTKFEDGQIPVVEVEMLYDSSSTKIHDKFSTHITFRESYMYIDFIRAHSHIDELYYCRIECTSVNYAITGFTKMKITTVA